MTDTRHWTIKQHIDAGHYPVQGQVTLRDGTTATIYTTDHPSVDCIVGCVVRDQSLLLVWNAQGRRRPDSGHDSPLDIVPPPLRTVPVETWAVVVPRSCGFVGPEFDSVGNEHCIHSFHASRQRAEGVAGLLGYPYWIVCLNGILDVPWSDANDSGDTDIDRDSTS